MKNEITKRLELRFVAHQWSEGLQQLLDEKTKLRDQFMLERRIDNRLKMSDRIDRTLYLQQIRSL